jgi:isopentenyl-diphosphate delta-isomerase
MLNKLNKLKATSHLQNGKRKEEHLKLALNEELSSSAITSGLEAYSFIHKALPEINLSDVDLSTHFLGKRIQAPLIISAMVGGIEAAAGINHNLATAAQALGLGMGVGSQRCLIEKPELARTFQVRDIAPDILLLANLGAVQFNCGFGVNECLQLVEAIDADALVLHLNPLQEALQPEGNTDFAHLLEKIEIACRELPVPVIVKEVGGGISEEVARSLANSGVAAIDIAGSGGTSWSEIERRRATDCLSERVASAFSGWGIPTADSILMARRGAPLLPIIASGGVRTGLDVAKTLVLGADLAGIAAPLLKPALSSSQEVEEALSEIIEVLRIALFCVGAADLQKLKSCGSLRKS